jgi:hypothetical protein
MSKRTVHQTAHLLDVGCGSETPLPAILYSMSLTHTTGSYTGLDYGSIGKSYFLQQERPSFHATWLPKTDFATAALPLPAYDVIVCLEVLEHVEPLHALRMLQRMRSLLPVDGVAFVSTPCYDAHVGAAANHVNEMTHAALRGLLGLAGLRVDDVWGTFASQKDYVDLIEQHVPRATWDRLAAYYDSSVLACVLAPLFPERARNCLWRLGPADVLTAPADAAAFLDPSSSSSALWAAHAAQIYDEVTHGS